MGGKPADYVGGETPAYRRSSGGARFDIWVFVDGGPLGEGPPVLWCPEGDSNSHGLAATTPSK
jgi:hypothetical protein